MTKILLEIAKTQDMHVPREVLVSNLPALILGMEGEVGILRSLDHNPLTAEHISQPAKKIAGEEDHLAWMVVLSDTTVMHQPNKSSRIWMLG